MGMWGKQVWVHVILNHVEEDPNAVQGQIYGSGQATDIVQAVDFRKCSIYWLKRSDGSEGSDGIGHNGGNM